MAMELNWPWQSPGAPSVAPSTEPCRLPWGCPESPRLEQGGVGRSPGT